MLSTPPSIFHRRGEWLLDLGLLFCFILIFYTCWLGSYPLFTPDEGRYSEVAREMIQTGNYITPKVNGVVFLDKPILYYWLQVTAIQLFGLKEWVLRLFPVLFGLFGCFATYFTGRYLYDRRTAVLAALILATSPLYFIGTHYANLDLELSVFITCTLFSILLALKGKPTHQLFFTVCAYVFAGLAFLTKGLMGLVFPIMIVGTWVLMLNEWRAIKNLRPLLGITILALIILPWYILVQRENPEFLHYFFVTQQFTRFLSLAKFNNVMPVWFYLPVVVLGFFPWTIFLSQALSKNLGQVWQNKKARGQELFLLLWIGLIFVFFSLPHSKIVTYILPILPALALLVGRYLGQSWSNAAKSYGGLFYFIAAIAFAFLLLLTLKQYLIAHIRPEFNFYLLSITLIFISAAFSALFFLKQKNYLPLVIICILGNLGFLLTLTAGAKHLNYYTVKPLVTQLKTMIRPEDEVVNYYKFYQDIPIYLEKRVSIVANWDAPDIFYTDNWTRELQYGRLHQKTDEWLINEDTFWQRWSSNHRMYVFLNNNYFLQFKKHGKPYYFISKYNNTLILSNQPNDQLIAKNP